MAITTYDGLIARKLAGYEWKFPAVRAIQATGVAPLTASSSDTAPLIRAGTFEQFPGSFETGVTGYIPTTLYNATQAQPFMIVGEQILLGTIDISGTSGSGYASMPTRTEGNDSHVIPGFCIVEVATALNATPGTLVVQYKDQNGNAAENSRSITLTASATAGMSSTLPFNTGDTMVTEITALTRSGGTTPTGVLNVYGIIPLAAMFQPVSAAGAVYDLIGNLKYRKYSASSQLGIWVWNTTTSIGSWAQIKMIGDS